MVWVAALQDGQNPCGEGFDNMNNYWIFVASKIDTFQSCTEHPTSLSAPCQLWMAAKALSKPIWILSGSIRKYLCSNEKPSETNHQVMLCTIQGVDSLKGAVNPYMPYTTTKPKVFPLHFTFLSLVSCSLFSRSKPGFPPRTSDEHLPQVLYSRSI